MATQQMKILLTGATGYVGSRLLPMLLESGYEVFVLVRQAKNFNSFVNNNRLRLIEGDLLDKKSLRELPKDLNAAYYLVHSMNDSSDHFLDLEKQCAENFVEALKRTDANQIIYLSGLSHDQNLSSHLQSRQTVEKIFVHSGIPYTIFRSGIIIGAGSSSFKIVRDLVEKLPVMITPRWVNNKTQPIAIADVLFYLKEVLGSQKAYNQIFEIGGLDKLTYKDMMQEYACMRGLKRYIIDVPVLTPRLSSYWLYFITSTNFSLASALVDSLRNETICTDRRVHQIIPHQCLSYKEAVKGALESWPST